MKLKSRDIKTMLYATHQSSDLPISRGRNFLAILSSKKLSEADSNRKINQWLRSQHRHFGPGAITFIVIIASLTIPIVNLRQ